MTGLYIIFIFIGIFNVTNLYTFLSLLTKVFVFDAQHTMAGYCFNDSCLTRTPVVQHFTNDWNFYSVLITFSFFFIRIMVHRAFFMGNG